MSSSKSIAVSRAFLHKPQFSPRDLNDAFLFARAMKSYRQDEARDLLQYNTMRASNVIDWADFDSRFETIEDVNEPCHRLFSYKSDLEIDSLDWSKLRKAIAAYALVAWEYEILRKDVRAILQKAESLQRVLKQRTRQRGRICWSLHRCQT